MIIKYTDHEEGCVRCNSCGNGCVCEEKSIDIEFPFYFCRTAEDYSNIGILMNINKYILLGDEMNLIRHGDHGFFLNFPTEEALIFSYRNQKKIEDLCDIAIKRIKKIGE